MRITYRGVRDNNRVGGGCKGKRLAEFEYSEKETERFFKIVEYLEDQGYSGIDTGVAEWAAVVVIDRDEYNDLAQLFKEAKRLIK